jgi:hypothetical protein
MAYKPHKWAGADYTGAKFDVCLKCGLQRKFPRRKGPKGGTLYSFDYYRDGVALTGKPGQCPGRSSGAARAPEKKALMTAKHLGDPGRITLTLKIQKVFDAFRIEDEEGRPLGAGGSTNRHFMAAERTLIELGADHDSLGFVFDTRELAARALQAL